MKIGFLKPQDPAETRIPVIPQLLNKFLEKHKTAEVVLTRNIGSSCGFSDSDFSKERIIWVEDNAAVIKTADVVANIQVPSTEIISSLRKGQIFISPMNPFMEKEKLQGISNSGVDGFCLELIPRTTRAQKMDILSSQANLAGYVAVVLAAERLDKILPMMMTPAGTINPSRVFIIGAGVAGLQAIATAKRMGARVEAFDTRPVVEEQVKSLGARFVKIDLGETGQTKDGYAKALTEEQLQKQRDQLSKYLSQTDILITTAQVFGRKAPLIVTQEMLAAMQPGSIVVDLAADSGGNVAGIVPGEEVVKEGVRLIGFRNFPGRVAVHASQMLCSNILNFIEDFWDDATSTFKVDREDEIIAGSLVCTGGQIVNDKLKG
jgi:H+-translocating NAD(P) transhydrogenase subunit alpha